MCYCCRKLENLNIFNEFGRPNAWEAVEGRAPLVGSDRSHQIREPIREHGLPEIRPPMHSASQIFSCDLSEPIRGEHGLSRTRPLMHTGRSNAFSREISQTAPRIGQHHPVCVRGRSGCFALGLDCITRCA